MKIEEKKREIKDNLRRMHISTNLIDGTEYNKRLEV